MLPLVGTVVGRDPVDLRRLILGDRGDAFPQYNVSVLSGFTCHYDGVGLFSAFIKGEAFDSMGWLCIRPNFMDGCEVSFLDCRVEHVTSDSLHHAERVVHVFVQSEKWANPFEQFRDLEPVCSEYVFVEGFAREVGVSENDFVPVTHAIKGVEEVWAKNGGDSDKHEAFVY